MKLSNHNTFRTWWHNKKKTAGINQVLLDPVSYCSDCQKTDVQSDDTQDLIDNREDDILFFDITYSTLMWPSTDKKHVNY